MRLLALEGWRGLTSLLVVLFHLYVAHALFFQEWLRFLAPVLEFFFIVSGFVMAVGFTGKVKDGTSFWAFAVRRAGRVFPIHWAMLGLLLLIPLMRFVLQTPGEVFSGKLSLDSLPWQIALLQTWWPQIALSWNHPAWTLSAEIVAYLIMALIMLASMGPRSRWGLALTVIGVSAAFFLHAQANWGHYNVVSISRALTGFFIGFLVYDLWRWFPLRQTWLAHILEIVATAGFVATLVFQFEDGPAYFFNHAAYALLVYVFANDKGFITRIVSVKPLLWLGKVSFSIYMFHGVVTTWLMLIVHALEARLGFPLTASLPAPGAPAGVHVVTLPAQWMNDALALGYLAIVLIGGHFIHRYIEDPSRRYFAKLGGKIGTKRTRAQSSALPAAADVAQ